MWQVLSQEAELCCEYAQSEVHQQKSNARTLVQMQVDKAIRKERELKSYMLELQETCCAIAQGKESKMCRHPIIEELVSGIIKGFASQLITRELRWHCEF
jgi:3-polyprenyl-4-hydroxybenzoate decarboxylase